MYENSTEAILKAKSGDKEELQNLIQNNNGLIWSIVKRFSGRGYETEDLYQIGCEGFIKSIKRFDANYEVKLSTYAVPYMIGEIKRFIRDDGPVKISRSLKELAVKINELQKEMMKTKGEELTIEEISEELKVSKEDVVLALDTANHVESIEGASYIDQKDGNKVSLLEKIGTGENEEEKIANKITIKEMISHLDNQEKQLILLRYYKDKTQTEVAKILNTSQVQVSRIEKKILSKMRNELQRGSA